jgi:hypothetical protein
MREHAPLEQSDVSTTIHTSFDEFESIHMAF